MNTASFPLFYHRSQINANLVELGLTCPRGKYYNINCDFMLRRRRAWPDGKARATQASCDGRIAEESRGAGGFGYDPIFYVSELAKNMAELTPDEKNQISHRGKALEKMMKILEEESMNEKKNFGE